MLLLAFLTQIGREMLLCGNVGVLLKGGCRVGLVTGARLQAYPELRPIRIRKDAFGEGMPERDMWVSPQHRMLVNSERALLDYGETEVLAPAKGLLNDHSITVDYGVRETTYVHILFDQHEVIFANGTPTESFHPGEHAVDNIEEAARDELYEIFPELRESPAGYGGHARKSLKVRETMAFCQQGVFGAQYLPRTEDALRPARRNKRRHFLR